MKFEELKRVWTLKKVYVLSLSLFTAFVWTGHCKVDETEKGWFIAYIDRDPETIERQKVKECYDHAALFW